MNKYLLECSGVTKNFPGVRALQDVSLNIFSGEVHVILGENGAGKSTLMKILAGVYQCDSGSIKLKGETVDISDPHRARELGISIIYQEFNLFPHLTVAQNIFIGREPRYARYLLNKKKLNDNAKAILETLRYNIDPNTRISNLSVAEQQMVEIAKAISVDCDVLIMDEPTAALSEEEITVLFQTIRTLREQKKGIVYISHRLSELESIADRVSVLRDGKHIKTMNYADTTIDELIKLMVGREINDIYPPRKGCTDIEAFRLEGLSRMPDLKDISFSLNKGEILGIAGLVGSGRTETMRAIFGADPKDSGRIFVDNKEVRITTPIHAIEHGIGYLTEDRKYEGLALNLNVADNIIMAHIPHFTKIAGVMDEGKCRSVAKDFVQTLRIKTPSLEQKIVFLSGGNQQKAIIARWLCTHCSVLIFDEPTRGIDVGAKREIYELINSLTEKGVAIIMVSSELNEILGMSDRIMVMNKGKIAGFLDNKEATQESIIELATR